MSGRIPVTPVCLWQTPPGRGWHVTYILPDISVIPYQSLSVLTSHCHARLDGGSLSDKVEEFVAGTLIFEEDTAEGRCGGYRIGLLHTSEGHTGV